MKNQSEKACEVIQLRPRQLRHHPIVRAIARSLVAVAGHPDAKPGWRLVAMFGLVVVAAGCGWDGKKKGELGAIIEELAGEEVRP